MTTPIYRHNQYTVHRIDGRLTIWEGAYRRTDCAPCTEAEAQEIIDELCRCKVCAGDKITPCYVCKGDGRLPDGSTCVECLGRGYTRCHRCGGSGVEPVK